VESNEEGVDESVVLTLGAFDSHGTTRARYEGKWIEVEHGIPGETVRAQIVGKRRLRGKILEIVEPAPDRVWPPCPYFRDWACGGCQWQQISYPGQVDRKRQEVKEAMHDAGLDLDVTAIHTLSDPWRYRSTAGIALGKHAGFRRHGSLAIVPIHDCPISHPCIGRLMATLNDRLESGELPDFHGRVRLDVRVVDTPEGQRLQTLVRLSDDGAPLAEAELLVLTSILSDMPDVAAVSVLQRDGHIEVISGELFGSSQVGGRPVMLTAGSFFQTNLSLLPELIARLRQEVEPLAHSRIADVYAGVGVFGLFLAEQAEEVVEIESDPLAIKAGALTAQAWDLENIAFLNQSAEEGLGSGGPFDVVIVDPPRSGLSQAVIEILGHQRPELILYVSCLARSLARDLVELTSSGYAVEHLELFDFYPQTYHVELLAVLRR
jgi:23S rRNA (uracil1939-C5)-methyltransferase